MQQKAKLQRRLRAASIVPPVPGSTAAPAVLIGALADETEQAKVPRGAVAALTGPYRSGNFVKSDCLWDQV